MQPFPAPEPIRGETTLLLERIQQGDRQAISQLACIALPELRRLAAACLRGQPPDHTWFPTDLVNELWVRLLRRETIDYSNRAHFIGAAAHLMRAIVTDHARARRAGKRSPDASGLSLNAGADGGPRLSDNNQDCARERRHGGAADLAR